MAELAEPFASFWAFLHSNFADETINQMLDGLPRSLESELQNPFTVGYTPKYLAYRTVVNSMSLACMGSCSRRLPLYEYANFIQIAGNIDIAAAEHPAVNNEPQPGDQPVNVEGLEYLLHSGQKGSDLLLDILEGGRASVNRHRIAAALGSSNKPNATEPCMTTPHTHIHNQLPREREPTVIKQEETRVPIHGRRAHRNHRDLSSRAVFKGCDVDEIPIPPVVHIPRDLEPYLPRLQTIWKLSFSVNRKRRVLVFKSTEKEGRSAVDDMVSDRHRQEFRIIFLTYIQQCLDCNRPHSFIEFHDDNYKAETDGWRKMAEEMAMDIKERHIDSGRWK